VAPIIVHVEYFASLRDKSGISQESLVTGCATPEDLYREVAARHSFPPSRESLSVAVNEQFAEWSCRLRDGDRVVFLTPFAGG